MLPKKYRLPIQDFYKKPGKAVKNSFFVVKTAPSSLPHSRFGVVAGGKVDKRPAHRNKIRRMVYEYIQKEGLHHSAGKDVMITILPPAKNIDKQHVFTSLRNLL